MHIVMLCRLYPPHIGGVEKHVFELNRELIKRGHSLAIVTEQFDSNLLSREIVEGVTIFRIPKNQLIGKAGIWSWIWKHRKIFRDADIVHAHDVFWWYLPLRFWFWNKRVFTTFHGYERVDGPTKGAILSRWISEQLSSGSICIGDWMRQWYHQTPEIVSYGAASFHEKPVPKNNSAVFIGRLDEHTGILEYIEGIKLLKGKVSLDIFGDGAWTEEVKALIRSVPFIHYKGQTNKAEAELGKHRFAFVSRYLGILEAQQVGRLVFAHLGAGIKKDYVLAFPTVREMAVFETPHQLAEMLLTHLCTPKLEKAHIQKAQNWAKKQTWKKMADNYESIWQR